VLVVGELLVPLWAERASPTNWHPHHIAERYGLFTLIVLGESVLAATIAIQSALDRARGEAGHGDAGVFVLAGTGQHVHRLGRARDGAADRRAGRADRRRQPSAEPSS
jgi:hypothetical protein